MPPSPIDASISNCGNFGASSSIDGGTKRGDLPPASVPVGKPAFRRHSWHNPWGASGASGLPQLGHKRVVSIICYSSILDLRRDVTRKAKDYLPHPGPQCGSSRRLWFAGG